MYYFTSPHTVYYHSTETSLSKALVTYKVRGCQLLTVTRAPVKDRNTSTYMEDVSLSCACS